MKRMSLAQSTDCQGLRSTYSDHGCLERCTGTTPRKEARKQKKGNSKQGVAHIKKHRIHRKPMTRARDEYSFRLETSPIPMERMAKPPMIKYRYFPVLDVN
jgi:hypothetical protein